MATLRIVGETDAQALLDGDTALAIARATLRDQATGGSRLSTPSAMSLDASDVGGPKFKFKAATLGHLQASGIRLLARMGANTGPDACNYTAIYDHRSGGLVGLVSEIWLSRIRTAAFGIAAIEPLVAAGPLTVGLFGSGDIATELMPLLARAFDVAEIRVNSRRPERAHAFAGKFQNQLALPVRAETEAAAVVADAHLVVTLTEAQEPLVHPGMLAPGAVLCTMGSYNEVAFGVLEESDRFIVDDPDYASEMGDGGAWIRQGHLTRDGFLARIDALAGEVAAGTKPGRLDDDHRILAIVQGMALGDVAFAAHILRAAEAKGLGSVVELP